jgi:transcriptional regulator with XRE-family HTH domain
MDYADPVAGTAEGVALEMPEARRPLHRLAMVRKRQGVSRRTMARRLKTDVRRVRAQEEETSDLTLSTLYEWQRALEVPVAELLVESYDPLSSPVLKRAQMVRLMKTAKAILVRAHETPIRRMAQMLIEQLLDVMPELEEVHPWHAVGQRRTQDEVGQAAVRRVSADWFQGGD